MKGMEFWKLLDLLGVRGVVPVSSVVSFHVKKSDLLVVLLLLKEPGVDFLFCF